LVPLETIKIFWKRVLSIAGKKDIFFNASAITFNLFICAIPFILILISILGYVLSYEEAFDEIVRYGSELFPSFQYESNSADVFQGQSTIESILKPLIGARTVFGILGIVILLFFTQGLLHSVKHVIFDTFDIEERKHPLMDMIYNFFGFGLLGSVFIFFSLTISLVSLFDFSIVNIPFTDIVVQINWVYEVLNIVLPILFNFFIMFVIYRYISEGKINKKVALFGAISYTILFESARFLISNYLGYAFSAYRYFYQGYAILVVIGIWVFYTALLFVITTIMARAYKEVYLSEGTVESNPYTEIS